MATADQPTPGKFPTFEEFCLIVPLYAEYQTTSDEDFRTMFKSMIHEVKLDCHCAWCDKDSIFTAPETGASPISFEMFVSPRILFRFDRTFHCSRNIGHEIIFHFQVNRRVFSKIGQWPSMADFAESSLKPYRRVLPPDKFRELSKGVGLASHGVGIGAFIYLRRVFESLIEEARVLAAAQPGWDQKAYEQQRVDEKIQMLHDHLPTFLVEQRKLYSILSAGVHSLTEEECLEHFPIVRAGIELILDEKLAQKEREEKIKASQRQIDILKQKLSVTG
jgi:hypothetical protein